MPYRELGMVFLNGQFRVNVSKLQCVITLRYSTTVPDVLRKIMSPERVLCKFNSKVLM